jgi:hypothetical protein
MQASAAIEALNNSILASNFRAKIAITTMIRGVFLNVERNDFDLEAK